MTFGDGDPEQDQKNIVEPAIKGMHAVHQTVLQMEFILTACWATLSVFQVPGACSMRYLLP